MRGVCARHPRAIRTLVISILLLKSAISKTAGDSQLLRVAARLIYRPGRTRCVTRYAAVFLEQFGAVTGETLAMNRVLVALGTSQVTRKGTFGRFTALLFAGSVG